VLQCRWVLLVFCFALPWKVYGQQRPFKTDDAEILGTGRIRVGLGIEFLQDQSYSLSGLEGNLIRLGVLGIHVGAGEYAEFQISGVAQDFLSVTGRNEAVIPSSFPGNSTSDFGNLILGTKLKLVDENCLRPAMAFKFAVELPNAKYDSGLGTNETEFYSSLLFKKHFGRSQIMADLGFAILGSPVLQGRQTDPFTYGIAAVVPVHRSVNFVAEIHGRQGPRGRVGNENKSQVRAGIRFRTRGIRWDLAGVAGLMEFDPKSGIIVGMTYEFQAFHRNDSAVKIKK
jgi:hypothetical protein